MIFRADKGGGGSLVELSDGEVLQETGTRYSVYIRGETLRTCKKIVSEDSEGPIPGERFNSRYWGEPRLRDL